MVKTMGPFTKKTYKRKAKKDAKGAKLSAKQVKEVKAIVHSNIENKVNNIAFQGSFGNGTAQDILFALSPESVTGIDIAQGTGQGDRIGNHIQAVKSTLDLVITPNVYDAGSNNELQVHDVVMFIFRGKPDLKTTADVDALVLNSFFQDGDLASGIFGDLRDLVYQPNMDRMTYFKRYHYKVGPSIIGTDEDGSPQIPHILQAYASNNDYKLNVIRHINTLPSLVKKMDFNDNSLTTSTPTTWCMIYGINANGSQMGDDQTPLFLSINAQLSYEDA